MAEPKSRAVAARDELDRDRRAPRFERGLGTGLPAPGEHQPLRRVDLDELAAGSVSGNHRDPVEATGAGVEVGRLPHPASRLLGIDQEVPDGLRAGVDLELADDRGLLSYLLHVCVPPLALPRA